MSRPRSRSWSGVSARSKPRTRACANHSPTDACEDRVMAGSFGVRTHRLAYVPNTIQRSPSMPNERKTVIVTGASQGIGAALVKTFLERGYSVVANSRNITKSGAFAPSDKLALVDGDIGEAATAAKIVETATSKFRSIDALVNNAGIFFAKPFTNYTADDFKSLASTNLEGFIYITQLAIKQMLAQKSGGSIV